MADAKPKCLIYARVSSEKQAGPDKSSLETQIAACLAACTERGYAVPLDGVYREVYTRTRRERPELDKLRERIRRREAEVIMALVVDRLSGDMLDTYVLFDEALRHGARIEFANQEFSNDDMGLLMLGLQAWRSQSEITTTKKRTGDGNRAKKEAGAIFGPIPTGFKRKDGEIVRDDLRAPMIERVFALASSGVSLDKTADILMEEGWKTPRGKARYSTSSLHQTITNPKYKGRWPNNQWRAVESERGQETRYELRPEEEWLWFDGPAIIDEKLWQRAKDERLRRKDESPRRQGNHEKYLLRSGYIFCGRCGGKMYGVPAGKGGKKNWTERYQYVCDRPRDKATGAKGCKGVTITNHLVDDPVWKACLELADDPLLVIHYGIVQLEDGTLGTKIANKQAELAGIEAEIARLSERVKQVHARAVPGINTEIEGLDKRSKAVMQDLEDLEAQAETIRELESLKDRLSDHLKEGRERLEGYTYDEKRTLIAALGVRVEVFPKNRLPRHDLTFKVNPWELNLGELATTPETQALILPMTPGRGITLPDGYELDTRGYVLDPNGDVVREFDSIPRVAKNDGAAQNDDSTHKECTLLSAIPLAYMRPSRIVGSNGGESHRSSGSGGWTS